MYLYSTRTGEPHEKHTRTHASRELDDARTREHPRFYPSVHCTCVITYAFYVAYVHVRDVTTTVINYPYVCVEMLPPRPAPALDLCLLESLCFLGWPVEAERKKKIRTKNLRLYQPRNKAFHCSPRVYGSRTAGIESRLDSSLVRNFDCFDHYYNFAYFLSDESSDFSSATYLWMKNRVI